MHSAPLDASHVADHFYYKNGAHNRLYYWAGEWLRSTHDQLPSNAVPVHNQKPSAEAEVAELSDGAVRVFLSTPHARCGSQLRLASRGACPYCHYHGATGPTTAAHVSAREAWEQEQTFTIVPRPASRRPMRGPAQVYRAAPHARCGCIWRLLYGQCAFCASAASDGVTADELPAQRKAWELTFYYVEVTPPAKKTKKPRFGPNNVYVGKPCVRCGGKVRYARKRSCTICWSSVLHGKTPKQCREQRDAQYRKRGYFEQFPGQQLSDTND